MGKTSRSKTRLLLWASNKQCGKLSTNGRQTVDVAQLDWDGDVLCIRDYIANSGVISVTANRIQTSNQRHVAGLPFAAWLFLVCNRRNCTSGFASLVERRRTMTWPCVHRDGLVICMSRLHTITHDYTASGHALLLSKAQCCTETDERVHPRLGEQGVAAMLQGSSPSRSRISCGSGRFLTR
jgi:hypothetical protein